jgi:hypothetical protein
MKPENGKNLVKSLIADGLYFHHNFNLHADFFSPVRNLFFKHFITQPTILPEGSLLLL